STDRPIGPQGAMMLLTLTLLIAVTPEQDFAARCAAPGVLVCQGFDDASVFTRATWPATGLYGMSQNSGPMRGTADSTIKSSGPSALRFEIQGNTDADAAGM